MVCLPGVATPTEAFAALAAGATGLKLFPAEMIAPAVVKALRAVLPRRRLLLPVGGITPANMARLPRGRRRRLRHRLGALQARHRDRHAVAPARPDFIGAWTGTIRA